MTPPKLIDVGVFGADCEESSIEGAGAGRAGVDIGARGVVGVVASLE